MVKKQPFRLLLSMMLAFFGFQSIGQTNPGLAAKIDSLAEVDQKWNGEIRKIRNGESHVDLDEAQTMISTINSRNYFELQKIMTQHGYPGFDLVGEKASNNFWLLVQHQDEHREFQEAVLEKMKMEVNRKNAAPKNFAYLTDRVGINSNQLQIYGTQMRLNSDSTSYEPMPTLYPEGLDDRRAEVGLPPMEAYIKIMNEHYFGTLKGN